MNPPQPTIDVALVHRLVTSQFPQWGDLPIQAIGQSGWDNRIFRLGAHMLVRMPSAAQYAPQALKSKSDQNNPKTRRNLNPLTVSK